MYTDPCQSKEWETTSEKPRRLRLLSLRIVSFVSDAFTVGDIHSHFLGIESGDRKQTSQEEVEENVVVYSSEYERMLKTYCYF